MTRDPFEQAVFLVADQMPDVVEEAPFGKAYVFEPAELLEFAKRFVGELAKGQEPIAQKTDGAWDGLDALDGLPDGTVLYTRPVVTTPADAVEKEPDHYCVTRGDGECISNHPLCMHNRAAICSKEHELLMKREWKESGK